MSMHQRPHEKLIVWKEAHALCLAIYDTTANFPSKEIYGLTSQMRRASYSVPMNIAEGNMRRTIKDKSHFLTIAISSLEELHYQCVLAKDLTYLSSDDFSKLDDHIQRVSYLLIKFHKSNQQSSNFSSESSDSSESSASL